MDLNGFKEINDTCGHHIGDALLKQSGDRLRALIADIDLLSRLGGDEFIIAQKRIVGNGDVQKLIESIRNAFSEEFLIEGKRIKIGIAVGHAVSSEGEGDLNQTVSLADKRMYQDKHKKNGEERQ